MADRSKISWTDATWNPVTGCTSVSAGCDHCYAKRMAERFPQVHGVDERLIGFGNEIESEFTPRPFSQIKFHPDRLDIPLRWKKPRRIFVCSMGDLFHEDAKDEWIGDVFRVMEVARRHTFMLLTKRPERMKDFIDKGMDHCGRMYSSNIWIGVTAENQAAAYERIPVLLQTPAEKRFVSVEPMLGPVDLARGIPTEWYHYIPRNPRPSLDWVICGGESGPGARPMHPGWTRSLRDQCRAAGVPFFFKQWGEFAPCERWVPGSVNLGDVSMMRVGKKAAGSLLDGREWTEIP